MEANGGRIDAGRVVGQALEYYREYAGPLLGAAAIVVGLGTLVNGVLGSSGSLVLVLIGGIVGLVAQFLYTGYVVRLVQDVRDGRRDQSVRELFSSAAPFVVTLILNGVLAGIGIVLGFIALLIPGLILITIWAVIAPAIVVEGKGAIGAFGRSRELVKGEGWTVFAAVLLAFVISLVVSFITRAIGASIGGDAGLIVAFAAGNILTAPIAALVASVLFFELGGGSAAPAAPEAPAA